MQQPNDSENGHGAILSHQFTDIDRFTEQVQSFSKVQTTQLSLERLQCQLSLVAFNQVQVAFVKSSCPIFYTGEKPKNAIVLSCLLESTGPCLISHNRKLSHHTLAGLDPDLGVNFVLPPDVHFVAVQINRKLFQNFLGVMERQDLDQRLWSSNYVHIPATISIVRTYLQQLLHLIQHQPHFLKQSHTQKLLLDDFIPLLINAIPPTTQEISKPPSVITRSRLVREAEEYMMAHIEQPLTLKELCQSLHVSARPLFYGFQEVFCVSPMEYLKIQRLRNVRQQLKLANPKTDSVMEIAQKYGFWSAGHFSRDYKTMFGELPSETLKQA
ncbi:MAG TPA: helix-turn-helix domain-containing protein [Coleofasciculaceae cyanobacterium]